MRPWQTKKKSSPGAPLEKSTSPAANVESIEHSHSWLTCSSSRPLKSVSLSDEIMSETSRSRSTDSMRGARQCSASPPSRRPESISSSAFAKCSPSNLSSSDRERAVTVAVLATAILSGVALVAAAPRARRGEVSGREHGEHGHLADKIARPDRGRYGLVVRLAKLGARGLGADDGHGELAGERHVQRRADNPLR